MDLPTTIKKLGIEKVLRYIYKDPEKNALKLLDLVDSFTKGELKSQISSIRKVIKNSNEPYHDFAMKLLSEVDPDVLTTIVVNLFINVNLVGAPKRVELREKYNCSIPWAILLDPTSDCNLSCAGCLAGGYDSKLKLNLNEIDNIIMQGKELGIYVYIYNGGEPLLRKTELVRLCEKHSDCVFLCLTNGTLIDEAFANEILRVKNFVTIISMDGLEAATDSRRGDGVYKKVAHSMRLLKSRKLLYGVSACYTSTNYKSITDNAFYDRLVDLGAYLILFYHYMPIGNNASPDLLLTPEQREYVYRTIRRLRPEKSLFAMDFQNDAEYVGGCIAGGRRYLHINANGDVEPCVFIHYSDSNIREKSLLDCLRSPLFTAYHDGQPFNDNMLRPCPMLENPERLREIVAKTGAKSTDILSPESVEHLCDKCEKYASNWSGVADRLWNERQQELKSK